VFTGGSLLVGSAARTDLVDPERTEELARAQYRSLKRLAQLDDDVLVWPTHGAGSFCSAPPGSERTSTIGTERRTNTLLRAESEDAFVDQLIDSLGTYPRYFARLGEVNRRGPALVDGDELSPLTPQEVTDLVASGAVVVDARPVPDFAATHVPDSLSIPLRPVFATWLGWLVEDQTPIVVVRGDDQDPAEILWQARKVGYDRVVGELAGGVGAWSASGRAVGSVPLITPAGVGDTPVLDIRQEAEFASGHLPGARNLELGSLSQRVATLPPGPTVVMCGHSERAMGAASVLARAGRHDIVVMDGGPSDWALATGRSLAGR
jgi:rhodanese-related sulfurtransferase